MSLALIPVDIIASITSIIYGNDIIRLRLCGNNMLWSKIVLAKPALNCQIEPLQQYPFSAFSVPNLSSLSVCIPKGHVVAPIRLEHRLPLPPKPIPTLERLNLSFAQSLRVLEPELPSHRLSTLCPHLTHLSLSGSCAPIAFQHFAELPDTLLHLAIRTMHFRSSPSIDYLCLTKLPKNLEVLILRYVTILADSKTRTYDSLKWPLKLSKLKIDRFSHASILTILPAQLEVLKIRIHKDADDYTLHTSKLPATLTDVRIFSHSVTVLPDGVFPPQLRRFDPHMFWTLAELKGMPPTIEKMHFALPLLKTPGWRESFPNLCTVPGFSTNRAMEYFPYLPTRLTLLAFHVGVENAIPWSLIPPHLTSTKLPISSSEQMKHVPSSVRVLQLMVNNVSLSNDVFSFLPPRLVHFSICLQQLASSDSLAHLPSCLEIFTLQVRWSTHSADPSIFSHLPVLTRLQNLSIIVVYRGACAWREWLLALEDGTRAPALEKLWVEIEPLDRTHSPDPSNSHLLHLPNSLREISLPITSGAEKDPLLLAKLPRKLRSLCLLPVHAEADEEKFAGLIDEQWQYIPKSITALDLTGNAASTPNIFKFLPPTISHIGVPKSLRFSEEFKQYYANDIFEGHSHLSHDHE